MRAFGPDALLNCYRRGVFPMAENRDDPRLFIIDPDQRGVFPLETFHVPRRLRKTVRNTDWRVVCDVDFRSTIEACAEETAERDATWINDWIVDLYCELHERQCAHSIEVYDGGNLVGGLYGVSLGGAFFGESMFSRVTDASKIALVHLVARLKLGGYRLLDAQFISDHLLQFGAKEIGRADFLDRLAPALEAEAAFYSASPAGSGMTGRSAITHSTGQTSKTGCSSP